MTISDQARDAADEILQEISPQSSPLTMEFVQQRIQRAIDNATTLSATPLRDDVVAVTVDAPSPPVEDLGPVSQSIEHGGSRIVNEIKFSDACGATCHVQISSEKCMGEHLLTLGQKDARKKVVLTRKTAAQLAAVLARFAAEGRIG